MQIFPVHFLCHKEKLIRGRSQGGFALAHYADQENWGMLVETLMWT